MNTESRMLIVLAFIEDAKDDNADTNEDPRRHFCIQQPIQKGFQKPTRKCREKRNFRVSRGGFENGGYARTMQRGGKLAKKRKEEAERRKGISCVTGSEPGYLPWK